MRPSRRSHVFAKRVGQQRQRTRLAFEVSLKEIHESGFDVQTRLGRRPLHRLAQSGVAETTQQEDALLHQACELGHPRHVGDPIGPERDHNEASLIHRLQPSHEVRPADLIQDGEDLLRLVDDNHVAVIDQW